MLSMEQMEWVGSGHTTLLNNYLRYLAHSRTPLDVILRGAKFASRPGAEVYLSKVLNKIEQSVCPNTRHQLSNQFARLRLVETGVAYTLASSSFGHQRAAARIDQVDQQ